MPITIPIPDARWRAAFRDRARRGRPLPCVRRDTVQATLWGYKPFRAALIAGVVGALAGTAVPGWLPWFVHTAGNAWATGFMLWFLIRVLEYAARRQYVARRARIAFGAAL